MSLAYMILFFSCVLWVPRAPISVTTLLLCNSLPSETSGVRMCQLCLLYIGKHDLWTWRESMFSALLDHIIILYPYILFQDIYASTWHFRCLSYRRNLCLSLICNIFLQNIILRHYLCFCYFYLNFLHY